VIDDIIKPKKVGCPCKPTIKPTDIALFLRRLEPNKNTKKFHDRGK